MSDRLRSIDALIAEHCMEWRWYTHHDAPGRFLAFYQDRKPWWDVASGEEHICQVRGPSIPRFSTDPAASKQARDKMREKGWKSCLFSTDVFTMRYWGYKRSQGTVEAHADTEELAVALAILAALQIEVPE